MTILGKILGAVTDHEKFLMAYFHMDVEVLVWFQDVEDIGLNVSWDAFVQAVRVKFGSTAYDNPMKATTQEHTAPMSVPMVIDVSKIMLHQMDQDFRRISRL